ncbi:hypothetical protein O3P69_017425 [Scylla paramamosain]|uniref:PHD-type domain-containing protein n=1 Tax=Scylla paramamosain TaxID=85552 RepID=A0AAW0TWX4_SCYPA
MDRVVPYPCITCQRKVRPKQQALQCDGCEQWQHRTCHTGISQEEYRQAVQSKIDIQWTCTGCGDVSAVSTTTSLTQPETPATICSPRDCALPAANIKAYVRQQGKERPFASGSTLAKVAVHRHLPADAPLFSMPKMSSIVRTTNRLRQARRSK